MKVDRESWDMPSLPVMPTPDDDDDDDDDGLWRDKTNEVCTVRLRASQTDRQTDHLTDDIRV